jgi:hypothetical protein
MLSMRKETDHIQKRNGADKGINSGDKENNGN